MDKVLEEMILEDMPVPNNVNLTKKVDTYVNNLVMTKASGSAILKNDKDIVRFQGKIRNIMGPLGSAWQSVENFRANPEAN